MSPKNPLKKPNIKFYQQLQTKDHKLNKSWHKFMQRVHYVTDVIMFFGTIFAAFILFTVNKTISQPSKTYISFYTPKKVKSANHKALSQGVPVHETVYKFTPKIQTTKYKYKTNVYGYKYKVKIKHPKVQYFSYFYLDPNYASKDKTVTQPIYLIIKGSVIKKISKTDLDVHRFNNSTMGFNSKKHYVLNDSHKYIYVMQFHNYFKYNKTTIPNVTVQGFTHIANIGPTRYLKLNEFKITRVKENLSNLATNGQLFAGFNS